MTQFSCTETTDVNIRSKKHDKNRVVLMKKSEEMIPPHELSVWGQEIKSEGTIPPHELSAWGREIPANTKVYS